MSVRSYIVLLLLVSAPAHAAGDYQVGSGEWNGLASLAALARSAGCPVRAPAQLDWAALGPRDVLWFVYPRSRVDPGRLERFVAAGGRVVLADDFGGAAGAFAALGIRRAAATAQAPEAGRYQENPSLLIARSTLATELGRSAESLVTNHPAWFTSAIPPTFAFSPGAALVIEGRLGRGSFVAIADPSVLINNMLELPGNRAFAGALIERTCTPDRDRILLFTQTFSSSGEPPAEVATAGESQSPFAAFNEKMRELDEAGAGASRAGIVVLAGFLGLIAVALFLGAFATPPPIVASWTGARHRLVAEPPLEELARDYGVAAAILRGEALERLALAAEVSLARTSPQQLEARVRARYGDEAGRSAGSLWRLLQRIRWREEGGALVPVSRISRSQYLTLHHRATALFAALGRAPGPRS